MLIAKSLQRNRQIGKRYKIETATSPEKILATNFKLAICERSTLAQNSFENSDLCEPKGC